MYLIGGDKNSHTLGNYPWRNFKQNICPLHTWIPLKVLDYQHRDDAAGNHAEPGVKINIENVQSFNYLCSYLSAAANVDAEIQHCLKCAGAVFGKYMLPW